MTIRRTGASLRAFGKPVLAGALVLLLLVSALASASPALHDCLHKDHTTPTHYCLVTVLDHEQTDVTSVLVSPATEAAGVPVSALPCESFFVSHDTKLYPERGPPALS